MLCNGLRLIILCSIVMTISTKDAISTHIIGGEFYYECVNPNAHIYKLTLKLYRDCTDPGNAQFDDPIYIGVYDTSGNLLNGPIGFDIAFPGSDILPNETYQLCLFSPPNVCVEEAVYTKTTALPPIPGGYDLVFQRCCRNDDIVNIPSPLGTGASWVIRVPDTTLGGCNSSPHFKLFPPTIICHNSKIDFDHSAIDPDGDSLVYEICPTFTSSQVLIDASYQAPDPLPNFAQIGYVSGYSYSNPLGGVDSLMIDSTGHLTGSPWITGQFVVAICVKEYRSGQLLSTNKRDFQFNIATCDSNINASIAYSIDSCRNIVSFDNTSDRGKFYSWDFGVIPISTDTSSSTNPVYEYADTGTYAITLIVNPGMSCADTANSQIKLIIPPLKAGFTQKSVCVGDAIIFTDTSKSGLGTGTINNWQWTFGDGKSSSQQNPSHVYSSAGDYVVKLIIGTDSGCSDTIDNSDNMLKVYPLPDVDAGEDVVIKWEEKTQLVATTTTSGLVSYKWLPSLGLSDTAIANPFASPLDTTLYNVTITDENGCTKTDDVIVKVIIPVDVEVPSAFTPNGDEINDIFYVYDKLGYEGEGMESIDFKIFDRWGELIFESASMNIGWNGKHMRNGKELEIGVYAWTLTGKKKSGDSFGPMYGNVSLIR